MNSKVREWFLEHGDFSVYGTNDEVKTAIEDLCDEWEASSKNTFCAAHPEYADTYDNYEKYKEKSVPTTGQARSCAAFYEWKRLLEDGPSPDDGTEENDPQHYLNTGNAYIDELRTYLYPKIRATQNYELLQALAAAETGTLTQVQLAQLWSNLAPDEQLSISKHFDKK